MPRSSHRSGAGSFAAREPIAQGQKAPAIGAGSAAAPPIPRRNWRALRARSLPHALELCLDHARERRRMSVERIADAMGLPSHWAIYRWVQEGSIPARLIRPYELACGCEYVSRWLAASAHLLAVPMPSGRLPTAGDIQAVQEACTGAVSALLSYAAGRADADSTLAALSTALERLAAERAEVERHYAPELPLEPRDEP